MIAELGRTPRTTRQNKDPTEEERAGCSTDKRKSRANPHHTYHHISTMNPLWFDTLVLFTSVVVYSLFLASFNLVLGFLSLFLTVPWAALKVANHMVCLIGCWVLCVSSSRCLGLFSRWPITLSTRLGSQT